MMIEISLPELLSLVRYAVRNKFPFTLTYILVKLFNVGRLSFRNDCTLTIVKSLTELANVFSQEIFSLIELVKAYNAYVIKVPLVPMDLTADLDVVVLDRTSRSQSLSQIAESTPIFKLKLDVYKLDVNTMRSFCRQYRICHLSDNDFTYRTLRLVYFENFAPRLYEIKIPGLVADLDALITFRNILMNGFVTYYDYINLMKYIAFITSRVRESQRKEHFVVSMMPVNPYRYRYPALIIHKDALVEGIPGNLMKFLKALINSNYTPVYGDLIQRFRKIACRLGKRELCELL